MGESQATAKTKQAPEAAIESPTALSGGQEGMSVGGPVGRMATLRPSDVVALQRRAGNRAVSGILPQGDARRAAGRHLGARPLSFQGGASRLTGSAVQRNGSYPTKSDEELIAEAIEKKDVGLIKSVKNLGKAKAEQKMPLITILNHQGWIGPFDEYALEALWGSFGDKVLEVAKNNPGEWKLSLEGGAELYNLPLAKPLADKFIVDARDIAGSYLTTNEEYATKELANLGVKEGADGGGAGGPSQEEQNARLGELSAAIRVTKEAGEVQKGLRSVVVGLERRYFMPTDKTLYWPMTFNPDAQPDAVDASPPPDRDEKARASGVAPENLARTPWKDVKAQWDVLTAIMTGLSIAYPVAGIGLMSGDKPMGDAASEDPKVAKAAIVTMLTTTRDSIRGTRPKLAGGLAYELSPIHQQLFAGAKGKSGIDWKDPIAQALAKEVLELKSNVEFWKSMGLATLAAAAFIIAEFATAGLATAALVGFGVGLGVGQAAVAWDKALTMAQADKATTGSGTELLASGQASMAMFEAALATVLVFVDAFQAAKPLGRALSGAVDKAALAAGTKVGGKVLEELGALAGKAPDKALVERAVTELGAEAVMGRTGKNAADLLAIVGEGSPIAARLKTLAAIPAELAKLTPAELAKRAGNLLAEVKANAATGEALAVLAVERMGPKRVLEMNGGWKSLSLALGNESAAGKSIMSWRDAFMGDIEAFVRTLEGGVDETGKAAVKRTGSQGSFTNDFDVSLLGPNASKNRNAVRGFVAGRAGTTPDRLGEMLLSDFFTDPRRLHLYDQLDPVLRAEVGTRAEKVAESTIMAKTLHDAEAAGNKELATQIRTQMKELGVAEVPFKPLSEGDRAALYTKIDDYHMQLEQALKSGDKAVQKSLVEKIGDTQGLINATEGGGYFSGGATRQIVTLAEGLMKGGTKPLDAQVYTTLLDQLPKLNSEASALMKSGIVASEEAVGAIKGIAKYGKRFRDLMSKLDVKVADEVAWNNLASRLETLLKQAKGEADLTLLGRLETEAKAVETEVAGLLGEFRGASQQVLMSLSRQAALGGVKVDLNAIQFLVMATAKLTRASTAVRESLRAIAAQVAEAALGAAKSGPASAPGTPPGTTPATTPPASAVQPVRATEVHGDRKPSVLEGAGLRSTGGRSAGVRRDGLPAALPPAELAAEAAVQRSADNKAVSHMPAQPVQRSPVLQRDIAGSQKSQFTFPDKKLGKKSLSYAQATLKAGGVIEYEVTPPTGQPGSVKSGTDISGIGSNKAPEGGGGTKASGGVNAGPASTAYQAEVSHEFAKRTDGWLEGWTPKAKIGGEAGGKGYKLGLEGSIEGENIEPKFGFTFFEADNKGEITFAALEAAVDLKLLTFKHTFPDGATATVSVKPTFKVTLEPDYAKLLQWFLEECAATVGAEVVIVGGFILGGVFIVAGTLLTLGDGEDMARIVEEAEKYRKAYVNGFVTEITQGGASFNDDYTMEGANRGRQWIEDLKTGAGSKGVPIPASVLKEKVKEHRAPAEAAATAAINAYLHSLLVKGYWDIHYISKWMGSGRIDTVFKMLMEGQGFGRPNDGETGDEPVKDVAIPASAPAK
jgi:hypothetical protein